ncbi:sugar ABC transporter ATP-binding protein [Ancylobacter sp. G4_0304]|uniref:sugar ABC transporter ATP-binding protein n=1 Tax=Ancylobacter sp. G4_0304 TaxID=3114289 RepID=UPI0039C65DE4
MAIEGPGSTPPLLEMVGIQKSFPGVHALRGVDFRLEASEIHALLGENGAGKSTLIKILSGAAQMDDGTISLNGEPVSITSPTHAKELGICTVYQEFMLVPQLSVAENIHLGMRVTRNGLVDWKAIESNAREVLDRMGFRIDPRRRVGSLSVHEQQIVEIAKALALKAKVLILDEPTAALTDKETERLFEILTALRNDGVGIVYITHNLEDVKRIGDRVTVLRDGLRVTTQALQDIAVDELPRLMIGADVKEPFPKLEVETGAPLLSVRGCSDPGGAFTDVSFDLKAGEIISFAGLLGAGSEAFVRALLGLEASPSGTIELFEQPYVPHSPSQAIKAGLFYLPADRKSMGLIMPMSVTDNATLAALGRYASHGFLSLKRQAKDASIYKEKLRIKTPSLTTPVRNLSGGNQQKVMIARALSAGSRILIFSEPTRGVDIRARAEIYGLLSELARGGSGVIFISQEVSEIIGMSDRVLIWRDGRIAHDLPRDQLSKGRVLSLITGA